MEDEGLIDEYDSDEKKYEIMRRRHKAIEELAATLEEEDIGLEGAAGGYGRIAAVR